MEFPFSSRNLSLIFMLTLNTRSSTKGRDQISVHPALAWVQV